jgi:aspartyl-tRNA(Asn)/glutamyl-tRNA(Gln) amidotransferase subunit A
LRLGVPEQLFFEHVDPEVRSAVNAGMTTLKELGAALVPVKIDLLDDAARAASLILFSEASAVLRRWHRTRPEALGSDVRSRLDAATRISAADYLTAATVRRRALAVFRETFGRVDALVTPQVPVTAPLSTDSVVEIEGRAEPVPSAMTRFSRIYNLVGVPALTLCCGHSSAGLPIAMQIATRPFDEATALRIGDAYQRRMACTLRRPVIERRRGRRVRRDQWHREER